MKLLGKALRLCRTVFSPQEFVDVHQSRARKNAFVTDMTVAGGQELQQLNLQFALWSEIRMSAFARENLVLRSVPEQSRLSQTCSRRDYCLIALRWRDLVESGKVLRAKTTNSPGRSLEIIDQESRWKLDLLCQVRLLVNPGKVGGFNSTLTYGTRYSKTRNIGPDARLLYEFRGNLAEVAVVTARENALTNQLNSAILRLKIG